MDDAIFTMNNDEFSKTYFQSIEKHIFFVFTLFHKFLDFKCKIISTFSVFSIWTCYMSCS